MHKARPWSTLRVQHQPMTHKPTHKLSSTHLVTHLVSATLNPSPQSSTMTEHAALQTVVITLSHQYTNRRPTQPSTTTSGHSPLHFHLTSCGFEVHSNSLLQIGPYNKNKLLPTGRQPTFLNTRPFQLYLATLIPSTSTVLIPTRKLSSP